MSFLVKTVGFLPEVVWAGNYFILAPNRFRIYLRQNWPWACLLPVTVKRLHLGELHPIVQSEREPNIADPIKPTLLA